MTTCCHGSEPTSTLISHVPFYMVPHGDSSVRASTEKGRESMKQPGPARQSEVSDVVWAESREGERRPCARRAPARPRHRLVCNPLIGHVSRLLLPVGAAAAGRAVVRRHIALVGTPTARPCALEHKQAVPCRMLPPGPPSAGRGARRFGPSGSPYASQFFQRVVGQAARSDSPSETARRSNGSRHHRGGRSSKTPVAQRAVRRCSPARGPEPGGGTRPAV
jgi:hypothetical protein